MKKTFFIILINLMLVSCGGINNSNSIELLSPEVPILVVSASVVDNAVPGTDNETIKTDNSSQSNAKNVVEPNNVVENQKVLKTNNVVNDNSLVVVIFLIIVLLILIFILVKRVYYLFHWYGTYKLNTLKSSTTIPFDGDLQQCFVCLSVIDPSNAWFQNKMAAFLVRMINNGDIELLEEQRKARIINPPAAELPSSVKISYENVCHCLLSILWENSDKDYIVNLNDFEINPFDENKDVVNYNRFEEYYNIISQYPKVKCSMISPNDAKSVMCLKKYLQEVTLDYEQNTTINGIPGTEYLVYECLFGITNHSDLNFYDAAIGFSDVWSKRLPRKDKIRKVMGVIKAVIGVIITILAILVFILKIISLFSGKSDDNDDSSSGSYSGRW